MAKEYAEKKNLLLSDPKVMRWYKNVEQGATTTANTWCYRLIRYLDINNLPIDQGPRILTQLKKSKTAFF